jgi:radical SAM protein with 4Fe4S-binding SPASM domain
MQVIRRLARVPFIANSKAARRARRFLDFTIKKSRSKVSSLLGGRFLTIRMDTNNKCNLKCSMCYFSLPEVAQIPAQTMPLELFRTIAEKAFPHTETLVLSCAYEPLLSPIFMDALDIVKEYRIPRTEIVTNGTLLTRQRIEKIVDAGITYLSLSIDAATKETYERIRVNANYDKLLANVRMVTQVKEEKGSPLPHLHVNYVLMRSNVEELPLFVSLAAELNMELVFCRHLLPYAGLNTRDEMLFYHQELTNECFRKARDVARKKGMALYPPPDYEATGASPSDELYNRYCFVPWSELYIRADGETAPCSWFEGQVSTGNFKDKTLEEIWNHEFYQTLRREFETGNLNPTCIYCLKDQSTHYEKEPFDVLGRVTKTWQ